MNIRILPLFAQCICLCGFAQDASNPSPDPFTGVWQGTIGPSAIHFCSDGADKNAFYYYDKHRKAIPLKRGEALPGGMSTWAEIEKQQATGHTWHLQDPQGTSPAGEWRGNDGRRLAIHLRRIEHAADTPPCSSDAMHLPTEIVRNKTEAKQITFGKTHRTLTIFAPETGSGVSKLEFLDPVPGRQAINHALNARYDEIKQKPAGLFDCRRRFAGSLSAAEDIYYFRSEQRLVFGNAHFVSVLQNDDWMNCDNRQFGESTPFTFAWPSGKAVKPLDWLAQDRKHKKEWRKLLRQRNPEIFQDRCAEEYPDGMLTPDLAYLTEKGVVMRYSSRLFASVNRACADEFTITPQDLRPFLSPQGKQALDRAYPPPGSSAP